MEAERTYQRYLRRAMAEDLSDIAALNFVYRSGADATGRPIIAIVPSHLPAKAVDLERVLLFLIRTLDPLVAGPYVMLYIHSNFSNQNRPEFAWLRRVYGIFNRK
jgi:hypothetical protein